MIDFGEVNFDPVELEANMRRLPPEFGKEYAIPPRTVYVQAVVSEDDTAAGFGVYFGPGHKQNCGARLCTTKQTEDAAILTAAIIALKKEGTPSFPEFKDREKMDEMQLPLILRTNNKFLFLVRFTLAKQFATKGAIETESLRDRFLSVRRLAGKFFDLATTITPKPEIQYTEHVNHAADKRGLEAAERLAAYGLTLDLNRWSTNVKEYEMEDMMS